LLLNNNSNDYTLSAQAERIIKKYSVKNKEFSGVIKSNSFLNKEDLEISNNQLTAHSNEINFF
jgi:hypothetical protein